MKLGMERLEDRKVLSAYTVQILDQQNLVPSQVETQMRAASDYVMRNLSNFINWKGTLDLRIQVLPPVAPHDGITPSITQVTPQGRNATIQEMLTGVDPYPNIPDLGMSVFLGNDGTVKLYGMKAYFDPNPVSYVAANVPVGHFDFIGVLNHEIAHSLGFQWGTTDFSRFIVQNNGYYYFNGPETVKVLGRPLPMSTFGSTHYGNYLLPDNPIKSGLMYQWGNYGSNRLDWGRLDLAVLKDVGLSIRSTAGLPLVDRMDWQAPKLVVSSSNINENLPAGTTIATVGTTLGSGYSFQIVPGWDGSNFRISGNSLVSTRSFDYESKSSYTVYVRMIDREGVWTDSKLVVRINDLRENIYVQVPDSVLVSNGVGSFSSMSVSGDSVPTTFTFFSRTSTFQSTITDPEVKVYTIKNIWGGTTLSVVGTPSALARNFRYISYKGNESSVSVQVSANNQNFGSWTVNLKYV